MERPEQHSDKRRSVLLALVYRNPVIDCYLHLVCRYLSIYTCGGGPLGLGGAPGVERPVAGGTGVLGGGGPLGLGRDPGVNLAVAGVLGGGGGGRVACCCGVATLADMMY